VLGPPDKPEGVGVFGLEGVGRAVYAQCVDRNLRTKAMEFFKANTRIRFMRQRLGAMIFSVVIVVASLTSLAVNGLNLGLDFTGGTKIEVAFTKAMNANEIRKTLHDSGFPQAVVQAYDVRDYAIRVGPGKKELRSKITTLFPQVKIQQISMIGPQVGKQLMTSGVLAVVVALLATIVYIALRFEFRFALSAALALLHDPVLILGVFSFFHLEFDLIVLAALLTVIGYSLNDTIVVYDRVRENFLKMRHGTPTEIVDLSINQTLSRTIMTSGLTLLVVVALIIYGGSTLFGFSLALIVGIVIGTYSSIYVAGSLAITFGLERKHLAPTRKQYQDELP
jgi:preprotein translocase subunit SecF